MLQNLSYVNEDDRCFGITGMAISLAVMNEEDKILEIDIDNMSDPIFFSHDFYFSGNPRCSAKIVWNEIAQNYNLSIAMAMGNILCRKVVNHNNMLTSTEEQQLKDLVIEEGMEACGLEADEIERLWRKDYDYLTRIFRHPKVQSVSASIKDEIMRRRTMSRHEIIDLLSALNYI